MENWQAWVGRTESRQDVITPTPAAGLSATLDRDDSPPQPGDALPLLWHWLYFLPICRQSELGDDGHAQRGDFLPPSPLPRRLYAGGRLEFLRPLRIGAHVSRLSRIADVSMKQGRSGPLLFVRVRHEISDAQGLALIDEQDIVYRGDASASPTEQPAPDNAHWTREIHPDPVLLFRYSALTFNSHRIHYDHPYATAVEGYPGLVVHGPLIATLLLDLLRRNLPGAVVTDFSFRAIGPLFSGTPFHIEGRLDSENTVRLWAIDVARNLRMDATATLA
jgi:3-methylfumaryl-CoA hydratase